MSGGFPFAGELCNGQSVANAAASIGIAVASSATASTKGSWVQLVASTSYDCGMLHIQASVIGSSDFSLDADLDIGIGASGSEVVLIPDLIIQNVSAYWNYAEINLALPLSIPAGTRIAARVATNIGAIRNAYVALKLYDTGFSDGRNISGVDIFGFTAGTTSGTVITPSATANTLGAWTQIIASTGKDYIGLFGLAMNAPSNTSTQDFLVQIGIGAAAAEQILIPFFHIAATDWPRSPILPTEIAIPSGSRLSAQSQSSGTSSIGPALVLYGIY